MRLTILLDQDVNVHIAQQMNLLGYDVTTVREEHILGASDDEVLDKATELGRVVFTHNYRDFEQLAKDREAAGRPHSGILLVIRDDPGRLVKRLAVWIDEYSAYELSMSHACLWLPNYTL